MNIDSHQHFWRYDSQRDGWITDEMSILRQDFLPDDLIPQLRANEIDGSVAVQADQSEKETAFLLELAGRYSEIKGVVGWVNLSARDVPDRLEHFSRFEKLCGFRHIAQSEPDDAFLLREDFKRGIGCLSRYNFSYDILIYPKQLPAAIKLVDGFPEQRFVIDHLAKPLIRTREIVSWTQQIRAIATNLNVCCKLSGLITEAGRRDWRADDFRPYLDVVFEAFGPERLMFGSDWPVCLLAGTYRQVRELIADYVRDLPVQQQHQVFGLNAISFYRLKTLNHELVAT
jgi:L-fuconolactonase